MMTVQFERWRLRLVQAAALVVISALTTGPSAQGLGDVARKEAERRQQTPKGKRYTNGDLPTDLAPAPAAPPVAPTVPRTSAGASEGAPTTGEEPAAGVGAKVAAPSNAKEDKETEQYWRNKAKEIRTRLQQLRGQVEVMEARVVDLDAQLAKGAGSSHVQEREVTQKVLGQARRDAQFLQDEWNRFEDRARARKIPPSWIE